MTDLRKRTLIESRLYQFLRRLPVTRPLGDSVIDSIWEMQIEEREAFVRTIHGVITCLERHKKQWQDVVDLVEKEPIKRVK